MWLLRVDKELQFEKISANNNLSRKKICGDENRGNVNYSEKVNHWIKLQNRNITMIIWFSIYIHKVNSSETANIFSEFDLFFVVHSICSKRIFSVFVFISTLFVCLLLFVFQQQNANFAPFFVVFSYYFKLYWCSSC